MTLGFSLILNQLKPSEVSRVTTPVLDVFLAQLAGELNKTVRALETEDEQCRAFNSLSDSLTVAILNNTLSALETGVRNLTSADLSPQEKTLVRDYLCGRFRINAFEDLLEGMELTQEEQEAMDQMRTWLNEKLSKERNAVMAKRVLNILKTGSGTSHFFALGLGHFVGEDTMVEEVRLGGWEVERVTVLDDLPKWSERRSGAGRTMLRTNLMAWLCLVLMYRQ